MAGGISISDTVKLEAMIHSPGLLITIGRYLPPIIAGFATLNLILAIMSLFVWGQIGIGIFNSILALASFIFLGQLLKRRNIHRYKYRYRGRHLKKKQPAKELERKRAEAAAD
jgi:hypothetical protein